MKTLFDEGSVPLGMAAHSDLYMQKKRVLLNLFCPHNTNFRE
jgi:hypothetical protein